MEEQYTRCQHSTLFALNGPMQFFSVSQYTSGVIVVPCSTKSTTSIRFLSEKTASISFLADVCAFWHKTQDGFPHHSRFQHEESG
jgi:3-polyprenyl-4-hydroxybenzoate decarboxylase